jgi:PAS domain S-box-containing protein
MEPIPPIGDPSETTVSPTTRLAVVLYSARFCRSDRESLTGSDADVKVTAVSAGSEALIDCPPGDLLGPFDRWLARVHADDREVLRAAIEQLGRQSQPVSCEYRPTSAKPGLRWLRDTLTPQLDNQGQLIGWEGVVTDITEQRALADDLRRTTNMLHALVDNLPTGVFFVQGPRGQPILVNARARQLLGQREDMAASLEHLSQVYRLHKSDGTVYPVEELPVYLALRKGLTIMRDDIVVHRPDGRRTPLVTWSAPIRFPPSRVDGGERTAESGSEAAVWVLEDSTALRQAEAARRDTEVRLRAILETMSEGVIVQDHSSRIVDCNAAASVILGQAPENLRGMALTDCDWDLMREDGTRVAVEDYPAPVVLRTGRPVRNLVLAIVPRLPQVQSEDRRGAGSTRQFKALRWMLVNAMPLAIGSAGEQRGARGVVSTFIDITTTMRAQRLLRESEEKYRELVDSLPLMVIQADTELHVSYVNAATRKLTGYELDEIAEPLAWSRLVHPEDMPALMAMAGEALAGRSGRAEYRYQAKDGSDKIGLAFCEPRRSGDGAILGTTTLIVDVTRERQLEQELLRAQRLELIGQLASGIAHDFNNLLTIVLSMTELAATSLPAGHAARTDLRRIQEATQQAANLASHLLAFSKQRGVALCRIDINRIIARTLQLLRASLPTRIRLKTELAEQELFVKADETQVQQVLMNLCLNARDAMPDGGLLHVRTEPVSSGGEWVRLSVRDQGMGIAKTVKDHLFDPFFTTKERGAGLGLAVVRQIVESHGGRVEVVSGSGQGAQFDIWWPADG